jgi:hypothetical protein
MSSVGEGRFVEKFGSYLQLHSCLSFAASVRDESAIAHLLQVAEHDPSHRDAVREIQKSNDMLFYDTVSVLLLFDPFGGDPFLISNFSTTYVSRQRYQPSSRFYPA